MFGSIIHMAQTISRLCESILAADLIEASSLKQNPENFEKNN